MAIDMDRREIRLSNARMSVSLIWHLDTPPAEVLASLDDVRAQYLADLATRQGARRQAEWQPIETAPKDGTPILATSAGYAYTLARCVVVFWDIPYEAGAPSGVPGWRAPDDEDEGAGRHWLTHWMPLPNQPGEEA